MNPKKMMLREWHEVCGTFRGLQRDDNGITVTFDGFELCVYTESEAEIVEQSLSDSLQGARVSILKTDLPDRPLLVKVEYNQPSITSIGEAVVQALEVSLPKARQEAE